MIGLENLVSLLSRTLEDDDHETAHEEGSVHHLLWFFRGAVVEHPVVYIIFVSQQPC